MKRTIATLTAGASLLVAMLGSRPAAQAKTAESIYADKCTTCHGADGKGQTAKGKKLKVKAVQETVKKMTVAQMEEIVTKGKDPDMDAFGKELGADMVKQITAYYRGLADKK
jgi:mono/diheme cytochrome c family protein